MAKATKGQKKLLKAIKKQPQNPAPLVQLGWLHFDAHEYNEAKQRFTQALDISADSPVMADAAYGLACVEYATGRYEPAKERLQTVIRDYPDFQKRPEAHFVLAQANEALWRDADWPNETDRLQSELLQRALDHYEQAIERRAPQHLQASLLLGTLYYDLHRYDDARPHLIRAQQAGDQLDNRSRFTANYQLGMMYKLHEGDLTRAREAFQAALKHGAASEKMAEVYRQLGLLCRQQSEDTAAVEYFERALNAYREAQSAEALEVLVNLGELKVQHHWYQQAIEYGEQALQISEPPEPLRQRLVLVLARAYDGAQDYERAQTYEQEYLTLCQDEQAKAESFLRLGAIYEHLGTRKKAGDAYRKGLKVAVQNQTRSHLSAALGRVYLEEERLNQALKHLKEAIELAADEDPQPPELYQVLGDCYAQRNETERALEMYGTVIAKYPDSPVEAQAREQLKRFRKQLKKDQQEKERALKSEELDQKLPRLERELEECERLTEMVNEILDEKGLFQRLKEGLAKTHLSFVSKIEALLADRTSVDDELIEDLEEVLILADLGVATTQRVVNSVQESVKRKELQDPAQVKYHLKREIQAILQDSEKPVEIERDKPFIILVIGVNGTGKTTTIGKMASKYNAQGKEVLLVAGDTFRAAAIEQLEIWGERAGCDVIKHASGADPSAVVYDAIQSAKSRQSDVVIADTAGRLHTKKNLMEELKKMVRVISREVPGAPHEILLVVDATTGQNAISQAKLFHEGVGVSGLILTKLDGTAKGGIVVSIAHDLKIPVAFIGIGERVEDLREFQAKEFVEALFED
jgi:fused signal recognition particle receptor